MVCVHKCLYNIGNEQFIAMQQTDYINDYHQLKHLVPHTKQKKPSNATETRNRHTQCPNYMNH